MALQTLRVGTRGSLLARAQTGLVIARLRAANSGLEVVEEIIQTTGDLRRDVPFTQVGTKGMFVKEIEQALLDGLIDVGVHSLKDMPSQLPPGLELACVPQREDPRDALLIRDLDALDSGVRDVVSTLLDALPRRAVVGTSSLRRQALLRLRRPDVQVMELRGNLDTRLRKLDEGQYDAIVVACAGLERLGLAERITERIDPEFCVPAAGQGALALETRRGDTETLALLAPLHDAGTADCVTAERGFLAELGGGCSVPAGALATLDGDTLTIEAMIASGDGKLVVRDRWTGARREAKILGAAIARSLLERGRKILPGERG